MEDAMFPKAEVKDKNVLNQLKKLSACVELHFEMTKYMFSAENGAIYPVDLFAFATINRSLNLVVPFCDLVKEKNIIVAAPLIRMQLDNLLRFYAVFLVEAPHDFAMDVMRGKHVRKLKDRSGNKMTDNYLHRKLSEEEGQEWITSVYESTSGYIHFSERHIFNSFKLDDQRENKFTGKMTYGEHDIEDSAFLESIEAFSAITDLLFKYLHGWCYTKANPEEVDLLRNEMFENS